MDYPSLRRLYSIARVLSAVEEGDSLTDIQHETRLSFQTIMKTVNYLEIMGILSTRIVNRKRGKMREIVHVSKDHKEISIFFEKILHKFNSAVNGKENKQCSSLLFDTHLLEESKKKMKDCLEYRFFPEAGNLFWEWAEEGEITDSLKDSIPEEKKAIMTEISDITDECYLFSIDIFSLQVDLKMEMPEVSKKIEAEVTG
jgi:hypothetical protein